MSTITLPARPPSLTHLSQFPSSHRNNRFFSVQVGSPVEVRQPDGQYLAASIVKLTDQSTYTVGKSSIAMRCVCACSYVHLFMWGRVSCTLRICVSLPTLSVSVCVCVCVCACI